MKTKLQIPEEIENVNKFTNFQLPNKFKIIGLVMFILSFMTVFFVAIYLENPEYNNVSKRIASTLAIFYALMPFINFSVESINSSMPNIQGSADVSILSTLLLMQILIFRKLKKAYNEE